MKSFETLVGGTTLAMLRENRRIQKLISQIVPAQTLDHMEFCRLEGGRLRITVDSAVWVSKFRFLERQIIGVLRAEKLDAHTLSFHIAPRQIPDLRKTRRTAQGSMRAASSMDDAAKSVSRELDPHSLPAGPEGACDPLQQQALRQSPRSAACTKMQTLQHLRLRIPLFPSNAVVREALLPAYC